MKPVCCFNASPATANNLNLSANEEVQEKQEQVQRQIEDDEGERRGRASVASIYSKKAANIEGTNWEEKGKKREGKRKEKEEDLAKSDFSFS